MTSFHSSIDQQVRELSIVFPDHDVSVIQMALESSGYHNERASMMLIEMSSNSSANTATTTNNNLSNHSYHDNSKFAVESVKLSAEYMVPSRVIAEEGPTTPNGKRLPIFNQLSDPVC